MLSVIEKVNDVVNNFIWGVPAMICIIGVGLLLSFRTGFIQIRKFPYAMKVTLGRMLKKREASDGALTPFQAVCTALAATVGTGNVAGVAGAIAIGGPGAVFWMWISALLGMCTKFSEVTLAVHFHERNANGDLVGGPMYYIKNGLKKHWHWQPLPTGSGRPLLLPSGNSSRKVLKYTCCPATMKRLPRPFPDKSVLLHSAQKCFLNKRPLSLKSFSNRDIAWPWSAMESTTVPLWLRQI